MKLPLSVQGNLALSFRNKALLQIISVLPIKLNRSFVSSSIYFIHHSYSFLCIQQNHIEIECKMSPNATFTLFTIVDHNLHLISCSFLFYNTLFLLLDASLVHFALSAMLSSSPPYFFLSCSGSSCHKGASLGPAPDGTERVVSGLAERAAVLDRCCCCSCCCC